VYELNKTVFANYLDLEDWRLQQVQVFTRTRKNC